MQQKGLISCNFELFPKQKEFNIQHVVHCILYIYIYIYIYTHIIISSVYLTILTHINFSYELQTVHQYIYFFLKQIQTCTFFISTASGVCIP